MEELAVNELSFVSDPAQSVDGYDLFTRFFSLCVEYAKLTRISAVSLWSSKPIKDQPLCGVVFKQWLGRASTDLRRFALSLAVNQKNIESYPEYLYREAPCQGLAVAADFDLLCLSFQIDTPWNTPDVTITRRTLSDTADTVDEQLSVRHASAGAHLHHHRQWLVERIEQIADERLRNLHSAQEFWQRREELFPGLVFCDDTCVQLEELFLKNQLNVVYSKLSELNEAALRWDKVKPFDHRALRKATPESASRKSTKELQQHLTIQCPDETERFFEYHVRFTPGAGRLYYFPDQQTGCLYIGYIGSKIV